MDNEVSTQNNTEKPPTALPLFHKNFTLIIFGQIFSLFGNAILRFALPLYILRVSSSASLFGLVTAGSFLPMIIMSPVGGLIADRFSKQRIIMILDFFSAVLILVFILISGKVSAVPLMVIVLMILFAIQGFYSPAVQASIPLLAKGDTLVSANAVVNLVQSFSHLLGPVIGGILFAAWGLLPILAVSAVCYLLSAVIELFLFIPHQPRKDRRNVFAIIKGDMGASLHFVFQEKPVLAQGLMALCAFNLVLRSMVAIGLPVLITQYLNLSEQLYGFAQGILAFGGLAGGLAAGVLGSRLNIRRSHILILVCSLALIPMSIILLPGLSFIAGYLVLTSMSFIIMTGATMFTVQMMAFVQSQTPAGLTGKVISFLIAFSMCSQPVGQMLYGFLFERFSGRPWIVVLGGMLASLVIAVCAKSVFRKTEA